ncbi:hypothetical protein FF1_022780 [Malus domestica]
MTKKGKGIALLLAQKSKIHRSPNLKSQTPNKIAFSKFEEAPLSESQEPDSQQDCFLKNQKGTILRISRARSLTGLLVRKPKRHYSPNFKSQISLDKACLQSSHATSTFQIPHTIFSKCSDKVKTREACSSHYIATTKKGKGITLLLVVRENPICRPSSSTDRQTYKNAQPFLISERALPTKPLEILSFLPPNNTYANQPHQSKSISYHQGQKQEYPISCFFPVFSFPFVLTCKTRRERKQSISTWNQASSQELTAWNPLPDYLPGIAFEYSSSTSYASRKDTTSA